MTMLNFIDNTQFQYNEAPSCHGTTGPPE